MAQKSGQGEVLHPMWEHLELFRLGHGTELRVTESGFAHCTVRLYAVTRFTSPIPHPAQGLGEGGLDLQTHFTPLQRILRNIFASRQHSRFHGAGFEHCLLAVPWVFPARSA